MLYHFKIFSCVFSRKQRPFSYKTRYNHQIRKLTLIHHYYPVMKSHSSFASFANNILYSQRIQFRTKHCIWLACLFSVLQSATVPLSFLDFHDLDTWGLLFCKCPSYFIKCPTTWVYLMFPHDHIQFIIFWQEYHWSDALIFYYIKVVSSRLYTYISPQFLIKLLIHSFIHISMDSWFLTLFNGF